ncbi:hypothetical protein [Dickeya zeae]
MSLLFTAMTPSFKSEDFQAFTATESINLPELLTRVQVFLRPSFQGASRVTPPHTIRVNADDIDKKNYSFTVISLSIAVTPDMGVTTLKARGLAQLAL